MFGQSENKVVRFGNLFAFGLLLLAIVFLTPNPGANRGTPFFKVALTSAWSQWLDWTAAWCSFKIILLNLAVLSIIAAAAVLLQLIHRDRISERCLLLFLLPLLGMELGAYYLLKALL